MKVKKNALSRVTAFLLAVLMVVSLIPVNVMGTVEAADSKPVEVKITANKSVYLYGVASAKAKSEVNDEGEYVIVYTGTVSETVTTYINNEKVDSPKVSLAEEENEKQLLIEKEWLNSQSSWVGICFGNAEISELTGVTVEAFSGKYDGDVHAAIESIVIKNQTTSDQVSYSEDGGKTYATYVKGEDEPVIKEVGKKSIIVKVERDGYKTYTEEITAEIAKGDLTGVKVVGDKICNKKFTGSSYPIIEDDAIVFESDDVKESAIIEYQKDGDDSWTEEIPEITSVGTYTYTIKVTSDDGNYEYTEIIKPEISYAEFAKGESYTYTKEYVKNQEIYWFNGSEFGIKAPDQWLVNEASNSDWSEMINVEKQEEVNTGILSLTAKNDKGEKTDITTVNYGFDNEAPVVGKEKANVKENEADTFWAKVGEVFFGKKVVVTVPIIEKESGVASVKVYIGEDDKEIKCDYADGEVSFTVENQSGTIKIEAVDKLGNSSGKVEVETIVAEIDAPEVFIVAHGLADAASGSESENIYNGNVKFTFDVEDKGSGIESVEAKIVKIEDEAETIVSSTVIEIGSEDDETLVQNDNGQTTKSRYEISMAEEEIKEGKYQLIVKATDICGNTVETTNSLENCIIYQDTTGPVINGFQFTDEDGELFTVDESNGYYRFYNNKPITVTIDAKDVTSEGSETGTAGVKTIYYKLVNSEGKVVDEAGNKVDENNEISFTINADFKGCILAWAVDKVNNMGEEDQPDGTIYETASKHESTSSIIIVEPENSGYQASKTAFSYTGTLDKESYNPLQPVKLYNENPTFNVIVEDTFSGIKNIDCKVFNGETVGEVTWNDVAYDENLVTKKTASITVNGNSNDAILLIEVTDNAGNTSYDYYQFGIDKTKPEITVTAHGTPSGDDGYYDAKRTATIRIEDQNFDKNAVVLAATRDKKSYEVVADFKYVEGTGHDTAYEATVTFDKEGDYTFKVVSCTDLAKNATNDGDEEITYKGNNPKSFTIDKTNPTISVRYNNNSAQNGKYFKAYRTATITVVEHNFDVDKVRFTQTARKNGSTIAIPRASWRHSGDVHTATISYSADGDYTFDVEMSDKAGRKNQGVNYGNSVAAKDFTVDTTIENPVIGGVKNGNAYNDKVVPTIKFTDINFENVEVKLVRTVKGEKNVDVTKEFIKAVSKNSQGGSGTFDTFKKIAENDGIYTLTVKMTDKAGNASEESVTFTVNRYGSVYVFDKYLTSLQDTYVQKVDNDIILTEYNASKLTKDSLELVITKDGVPIKNVAYKVSPVINDNVNVGSSGWYQYQYTIDASNFTEDGVYRITIASKDAAGNTSETTNYEDCEMLFYVDSEKPEITNITGLTEDNIFNAEKIEVSLEAFDSMGLESITVYLDGEIVKVFDKFEDLVNFVGSFDITEGSKQELRIVVKDLAGNVLDTSELEDEDGNKVTFEEQYGYGNEVTVSTNFFVRWFANTPLFVGSMVVLIAVVAGAFWFFVIAKRKNDEDEEETK